MTRQSTGRRPVFSASAVLDAIAADLATIKAEDGLTDADIGRVLGKSEDQAAKYRAGLAEMGVVALFAGEREWNGRFTGSVRRLVRDSRPASSDAEGQCAVLRAALALSQALADDGVVTGEEVRRSRAALEDAKTAIEEQLAKLVRAA